MHLGFRKGVDAVPMGMQTELKTELVAIIGGKTRCKLFNYINGKTIIRPEISKQIEAVFAKYSLFDIWDR